MEHLTAMTDDQLVNLFISGQNAAFDTLLSRHQDRLYSFIRYYVRNADLADDLFQETFVKAIVSIRQQRYTGNGKFYAWLTRIAHNLLVAQIRNENNEQIVYGEGTGDGRRKKNHEPPARRTARSGVHALLPGHEFQGNC